MAQAKRYTQAALLRRQLDRKSASAAAFSPPREGWIKAVRAALGINGRLLASRMGIARSHLSHLESAELTRAVTLKSLTKVADALDCDVVYAFVPRAGTFEKALTARARAVAKSLVDRVAGTMALEAQATDDSARERLIESTATDLVRTLDKCLWDSRL